MAVELKTKQNDASVAKFLDTVADERKRKDCYELVRIMEDESGEPARMWGTSIVGFGSYHYKYASGHEGDSCLIGFSPRKQNITMYILTGGAEHYEAMLSKLGKHKTGKGCLYVNSLADIDTAVLRSLIKASMKATRTYLSK